MKKVMETSVHLSLCMAICALFIGCSDKDSGMAGATSETTNGIAVVVYDGARQPVPQARVTLYSKTDMAVVQSAVADDAGTARLDSLASDCATGNCFVEGIAGADSALMNWGTFGLTDSVSSEIELAESATLTVRTGTSAEDALTLFAALHLESTPYMAALSGGEYVFAHVPAGMFIVMAGDSNVTQVTLEAGSEIDTLVVVPGKTQEFVFEDFEDGDIKNNLAAKYKNFGWYRVASGTANWISPDTSVALDSAIVEDARGKVLSIEYSLGDSGYVLLGTHLGLDSGYYDLSSLSAIRMTVSGDCEIDVALEHYLDVGDNNFRKSLWHASVDTAWREIVLRPGKEVLMESAYQVSWDEISKEIGFLSIFVNSGSYLKIDKIVFEGVDGDAL